MTVSFTRLRSFAIPCAWTVAALLVLGCAPAGGPVAGPAGKAVETVEVVAVEEKAPGAMPSLANTAAGVRRAVESTKEAAAAADRRIEEAAQSIDTTVPTQPPAPQPESAPEPQTSPEPKPEPQAAPPASTSQVREQIVLGDPTLTAGVPGTGPITLAEIDAWLADPRNFITLDPVLPLGLSQGAAQITGLDKNPLTRAKVELGRQLYFDPRLSADSTVSCASCHDPAQGYSAHTKTGVGIRGQLGGRNSPVSYNRILTGPQFWDGRADSLEAQAVGPIQNPIEMGFSHEGVVKRLAENPVYARQFEKIFGELTIDRVGQAIAAFERVLVTGPSPYDYEEQWRPLADLDAEDLADDADLAAKHAAAKAAVEEHPMSDEAKRGREIFFGDRGNCTACHVGANLADEKYHNLGIGMDKENPDLGRFTVTKNEVDTGAFKTPTIRNVALTAPYMHDGSVATLAEVVDWYAKGGHPNPHLSDKIKPLDLSTQDKADLVAFMEACTGPTPPVEAGRLPADAQ